MNPALWLPLAVLAYATFAVNGVIDKVVVSRKIKDPVEVSFWVSLIGTSSALVLILGLAPGPVGEFFRFRAPDPPTIFVIALGGISLQLGLLLSYYALKRGEATRVQSTIGAAVPIFTLVLARAFLGERLSGVSLLAFAVLVAGAATMLFRRGRWLGLASVLAAGAALLMALQTVVAKGVYGHNHFISSLVLFGLGNIVYCMVLLVVSPSLRRTLRAPSRRQPSGKPSGLSGRILIAVNAALGGVGVVCLNLAIKYGSVTLVSGLKGLQYAGIFVIAVVFSWARPKLLREELSGQTMQQKVAAVAIIAAGLGLLAATV